MVPTKQGYLRQLLKQLPADTKLYMKPYVLYFKRPSGTSRGVLTEKTSYFFWLHSTSFPNRYGIGEAAPLQGLSIDYEPDLSIRFNIICQEFNQGRVEMVLDLANTLFPSLKFALETACLDWLNGGKRVIFESNFTSKQASIAINGLIWMGNEDYMKEQLIQKIEEGYSCVKLKIGAIDFDTELKILNFIRQNFDPHIEIRVDANGAFDPKNALKKVEQLSAFNLHSIEQPIAAGNLEAMRLLCRKTPVPIALDEELIGFFDDDEKRYLLDTIQPQYIILKPGLLGGFEVCDTWISIAQAGNIGYWLTSALETNIGLNAIANYAYLQQLTLQQGLGTGQLFHNNIPSPLHISNAQLANDPFQKWDLHKIDDCLM